MSWRPLLLMLPLVVVGLATAQEEEPPALWEPLPFQHLEHRKVFRATGVSCIDCHPVGMVTREGIQKLPAPLGSCHGCHRGEYPGAPRGASSACARCHSDLQDLMPPTHSGDWRHLHAPEARASDAECADCHEASSCFECHDDRGPMAINPHGPGFRVTHGIEARLDPRSCATCHDGSSCVDCHATGSLPW